DALVTHRRQGLWQAAVPRRAHDLLAPLDSSAQSATDLPAPSERDTLRMDYQSLGYTLGRHPLSFMREDLRAQRYRDSQDLQSAHHGQLVRACGLVTLRQRPHTARGVMFITLEDEHGHINVVIQPHLIERERTLLLSSVLLGVVGTWQTDGRVAHLLAGRLVNENARLTCLDALPRRRA
ncbi:MAG TPA: error-prone DNA polymerase, partial [Orrella sp.]